MGDEVACRFLVVPRLGPHLCSIREDPETLRKRETLCLGMPARCHCPGLREREITRLAKANRASEAPVSILVRLARRAGGLRG